MAVGKAGYFGLVGPSLAASVGPTAAVLCISAYRKQGEGRWEARVRCFTAHLPLFRRAFHARSAYSFPLQCPQKPHRQRFPASEIKSIHPECAASLTAPPFCRAPRFFPKRSIPRPSFLGAGCGRRRAEGVRGSPEGFNPSGGIPKGETLWRSFPAIFGQSAPRQKHLQKGQSAVK